MKKSEKIIVSLVVAAALYGATDFLLSKKGKKGQDDLKADPGIEVINTQMQALSSNDDKKLAFLADNISNPWQDNIFFLEDPEEVLGKGIVQQITDGPVAEEEALPPEKTEDEKLQELLAEIAFNPSDFSYSGYLEMGNEQIAIINGLDYRVGDMISNFLIENITQKSVILAQKGQIFEVMAHTSENSEEINKSAVLTIQR